MRFNQINSRKKKWFFVWGNEWKNPASIENVLKYYFIIEVVLVRDMRTVMIPSPGLCSGMAGTAYFLSDILVPETASFPAFELTWSASLYRRMIISYTSARGSG